MNDTLSPPAPPTEYTLTVEHCAHVLKRCTVTIRKWCRRGILDALQPFPHAPYMIHRDAIARFEARPVETTEQRADRRIRDAQQLNDRRKAKRALRAVK